MATAQVQSSPPTLIPSATSLDAYPKTLLVSVSMVPQEPGSVPQALTNGTENATPDEPEAANGKIDNPHSTSGVILPDPESTGTAAIIENEGDPVHKELTADQRGVDAKTVAEETRPNDVHQNNAQSSERHSSDYVDALERRLQHVEQLLRSLQASPSEASLSPKAASDDAGSNAEKPIVEKTERAKSDDGEDEDDDPDKIIDSKQEVKLEKMTYEQFRKVQHRLGICKGSVLQYVTAPKGRIGNGASTTAAEDQVQDVPYRLAINSHCLLDILGKLMNVTMRQRNVHSRPFKYLIANEKLIKEKLQTLEDECKMLITHDARPDQNIASEADNTGRKAAAESPQSSSDGPTGHSSTDKSAADEKVRTDDIEKSDSVDTEDSKKIMSRDHLRLLVDFMDNHIADIPKLRDDLDEGIVDELYFEDLQHLFRPGQIIFQTNGSAENARRAYQVLHVTGGRPLVDLDGTDKWSARDVTDYDGVLAFDEIEDKPGRHAVRSAKMSPVVLDCAYLDSDGEFMGPKATRIPILAYEGKKAIRTMDVYPAHYDENRISTEIMLTARGKRFVEFAKIHHRNYEGRSLKDQHLNDCMNIDDDEVKYGDYEVSCECVVDQAYILGADFSFKGGFLARPSSQDKREVTWLWDCAIKDCTSCSDMYNDVDVDQKYRTEFMESEAGKRLLEVRHRELFLQDQDGTYHDLIRLLPLRLYGYALADRRWHALDVNNFAEKVPDQSFNDLVLPEENKKLLQALVKNHVGYKPDPASVSNRQSTSAPPSLDIIRGKGRGLIVLLHGVPGVGKTSTAESIAAQLDRPLFPITCGDLGTTAIDVESALEGYFRLAAKWKCVLLLDEADVFLAQRKGGDFKRNGLVSVFLRVLEYYSGILILTTNRVGEFDEAFRSRIHISLYYPPLEQKSTEDIWKLNLRRIHENPDLDIDVEEAGIMAFCKKHWEDNREFEGRLWNGRQIKNGFQTAIALANWDFWDNGGRDTRLRPLLTAKQFEYVAKTSAAFDDYLDSVHHSTDMGAFAEWAATHKLRNDNYSPTQKRGSLPHRNSGSTPRRPGFRHPTPSTPRNGSARAAAMNTSEPEEMNENDAKIKAVRVQLKNLEKRKISDEKREDLKYQLQCQLDELGVPNAFDDDEDEIAPHLNGRDSSTKSPWA